MGIGTDQHPLGAETDPPRAMFRGGDDVAGQQAADTIDFRARTLPLPRQDAGWRPRPSRGSPRQAAGRPYDIGAANCRLISTTQRHKSPQPAEKRLIASTFPHVPVKRAEAATTSYPTRTP